MSARGRLGLLVVIGMASCSSHGGDGGRGEALKQSAQGLAQGPVLYGYDALGLRIGGAPANADLLGRTTTRGDATLAWGADGQLAAVTDGAGSTTEMITDETGHRLAWRKDGVVVAAQIDGVHLAPGHIQETPKVGGRAVGVLDNGTFALTPLDLRGSVTGDGSSTGSSAGPYGERSAAPAVASIVDYAAAGADPALGTIVMGIRDYDPDTGAFLAPDPKYLEHPQSCVDSPVECSLYGYARAQPADFVDPTGKDAVATEGATAGAYSSTGGDPSSVGGLCWDHAPTPGRVVQENPGWRSTREGSAYSRAYNMVAQEVMYQHAAAAMKLELDTGEQASMGLCRDCARADGSPNPNRLLGPGDHVSHDLGLITGAGGFSSLLMTATAAFSLIGYREPNLDALLRTLEVTKIMDDFIGYMGVSTYGELQNFTVDDPRVQRALRGQ